MPADSGQSKDESAVPRPTDSSSSARADFERRAEEAAPGLVAEFLDFLLENRKWWLLPIVIVLLLVGVFLVLSSSVAAPFLYPLF